MDIIEITLLNGADEVAKKFIDLDEMTLARGTREWERLSNKKDHFYLNWEIEHGMFTQEELSKSASIRVALWQILNKFSIKSRIACVTFDLKQLIK